MGSNPPTYFDITPATATISVTPISGLVYGIVFGQNGSSPLQQETANYSAIGVNGPLPSAISPIQRCTLMLEPIMTHGHVLIQVVITSHNLVQ